MSYYSNPFIPRNTQKQREFLQNTIDQLLAERRKSRGGWSPVTADDLRNLRNIIDCLIAMKWEQDPDGDHPVDVDITDLTQYRRPFWLPIPHAKFEATSDEQKDMLRRTQANLDLAVDMSRRATEVIIHGE